MSIRKSPAGGYDFGRKRQYRRDTWATARRRCQLFGYTVADSHALLMPSTEGDEIEVAMNNGFMEAHLHVVDRNPAIVATLKRRWPRINTYGVSVDRAASRIAAAGIRLRFANLDLCGPTSDSLALTLSSVSRSGCFDEMSSVAVTVLRGREHREFTDRVSSVIDVMTDATLSTDGHITDGAATRQNHRYTNLSVTDFRRLMFIAWSLTVAGRPSRMTLPFHVVRSSSYLSTSGQTMMWAVIALYQLREEPDGTVSCLRPADEQVER